LALAPDWNTGYHRGKLFIQRDSKRNVPRLGG
jgi:hypothetical protein